MSVLLEVSHLAATIQAMPALRDLSLQVGVGEMVSLVGRNGAGKTSFMRAVMGHLAASAGEVRFAGKDLKALPRHARARLGIGYMPEDRGLVPQLTVEENISLPLWVNKGLPAAERLALAYRLLPEVEAMRERRALLLSGGSKSSSRWRARWRRAPGSCCSTSLSRAWRRRSRSGWSRSSTPCKARRWRC